MLHQHESAQQLELGCTQELWFCLEITEIKGCKTKIKKKKKHAYNVALFGVFFLLIASSILQNWPLKHLQVHIPNKFIGGGFGFYVGQSLSKIFCWSPCAAGILICIPGLATQKNKKFVGVCLNVRKHVSGAGLWSTILLFTSVHMRKKLMDIDEKAASSSFQKSLKF